MCVMIDQETNIIIFSCENNLIFLCESNSNFVKEIFEYYQNISHNYLPFMYFRTIYMY